MSRIGQTTAAAMIVVAMLLAALFLWVGIPVLWLYIASQLVDSSQPSMGPYLVVVVGVITTVVLDALLISRLNRQYERVTGSAGEVRVQLPWMKSMRGEREQPRGMSVLDAVLIASVTLAGVTFGLWFFVFAGSSLPGS
ncbi:MAG: hypothetical protein M3155_05820 [Actinomycetota bacterium]|nr:hypothetical protein [Actinomycetota bacterium]